MTTHPICTYTISILTLLALLSIHVSAAEHDVLPLLELSANETEVSTKAAVTEGETDPVLLDLDPYLIKKLRGTADGDGGEYGPDGGMANLFKEPEFIKLVDKHKLKLFSGPIVGRMTKDSVSFKVRTAGPASVQIVIGKQKSKTIKTVADNDFTADLTVSGLKKDGQYSYHVLLDKKKITSNAYSFQKLSDKTFKGQFEIQFGSGARYIPENEPIWDIMRKRKPIAYLALGDNVYIDMPKRRDVQRLHYYRRQLRTEHRNFLSSVQQYAIYDDHDFGNNDSLGGPEIASPKWKIPVWNVFQENWINPDNETNGKYPGCWFRTSIGDVDIFMLDGRYYRTKNKKHLDKRSMLGPVQQKWIIKALAESKATFKVLASGTMWTPEADKDGKDSWEYFKKDRDELFDSIVKNKVSGVILITGDRHRADIWKIEHPGCYPLYEFVNAKVTNIHTHKKRPEAIWSYSPRKDNIFGSLVFNFKSKNPTVTHHCVNKKGEEIKSFPLKLSDLSF